MSVRKCILTGSFDFEGPSVRLVPLHRRGVDDGWLRKHASYGVFSNYLSELRPIPKKTVIHVIAVGDDEAYGPNRNFDGFSREDNRTAHKSFKDIGHVFRHHQNDDPFKAVGDVLQTAHNELMSRIELLLALDNEKCRSEVEAANKDEEITCSMGCFTAGHRLTLDDGSTILLEDAKVGDRVLTHTGAHKPVTYVFEDRRYTGTLYRFSARALEDIEATAEHPFFIVRSAALCHTGYSVRRVSEAKLESLDVATVGEWVAASAIRAGDYLVSPVNTREELPDYSRLRVGNYILTPVSQIETREVVEEPIYNVEVADDNSYVINGVGVHNSMQDFDVCSLCGHRAPTAQAHCEHIKKMLGLVLSDGRRIYMKNPNPKFFDISLVWKPADRIAYMLRKVASDHGPIGGHDLAELFGLNQMSSKIAMLRTLASLYKETPATLHKVTGPAPLKPTTRAELRKQAQIHGVDHLLAFLSANKWLLGPGDFANTLGHENPAMFESAVRHFGGLQNIMADQDCLPSPPLDAMLSPVRLGPSAVDDLNACCSMEPEPVQRRVIRLTIMSPTKVAGVLPPEPEARAMALLYSGYKVAFAEQLVDYPSALRAVAASF